jgi:hypothetical protein
MTELEIANKYVYGNHDALTDKQEVMDMVKDIKELIKPCVMQALPKRLSNAAYIQATNKGYEEFMIWWDKQV